MTRKIYNTQPGIYGAYVPCKGTIASICEWADRNKLAGYAINPKELHVTTIYSKSPFDMAPSSKRNVEAKFSGLRYLGPEGGVLVILLSCPYLHQLFSERLMSGADWSFPQYIPHMTVAKGLPRHLAGRMSPIQFPINLEREYVSALDEDFSYSKTTAGIYIKRQEEVKDVFNKV